MHEMAHTPSTIVEGYSNENRLSSRLKPRQIAKFWFPVLVLFSFCMAVSAESGYAASGGEEVYNPQIASSFFRQLAFLGLGISGFCFLAMGRPIAISKPVAWTVLVPMLILLLYVFLSILWSDDPLMTMKRAITAILLVVAGLGIGRIWDLQDYSWGIFVVSSLFLALGIIVELRYLSFLSVDDYRFSGLFHPAKQAFNCGFLLLASLSIYFSQGRRWILFIAALALACLILTKARTGTGAALLAGGWLAWNYASQRNWFVYGLIIFGLGVAGLLFYQGATGRDLRVNQVMTMGRDDEAADPSQMSGRLPIWKQVIDEYAQQPVLGYGYGAFWTMRRLAEFERSNGWALYHAHSTYLEALVNLGLVGFGLGICTLAVALNRCVTLVRYGEKQAVLIIAILLFAFVGGFTEVAFIGLEYESLVPMIGLGLMTFAGAPKRRQAK